MKPLSLTADKNAMLGLITFIDWPLISSEAGVNVTDRLNVSRWDLEVEAKRGGGGDFRSDIICHR